MVLPPHALSQLEPKLFLKVDALVLSQVDISVVVKTLTFRPSPEALCRQRLQISESPLVTCEILRQLFALHQEHLVFFKRCSSQEALRVGNPLVHIYKIGDLKLLKHSASQVVHCAEHCRSLMITCVDIGEIYLYKVFLTCRTYVCVLYFLSIITVFQFI